MPTKFIPEAKQFFMVFRTQLAEAQRQIASLTDPVTAYGVLLQAMCALEHDRGVIRLDKHKLAADLGITVDRVEQAMDDLLSLGIFFLFDIGWECFDKMALNPHLAWKGTIQMGNRIRGAVAPITRPSV